MRAHLRTVLLSFQYVVFRVGFQKMIPVRTVVCYTTVRRTNGYTHTLMGFV